LTKPDFAVLFEHNGHVLVYFIIDVGYHLRYLNLHLKRSSTLARTFDGKRIYANSNPNLNPNPNPKAQKRFQENEMTSFFWQMSRILVSSRAPHQNLHFASFFILIFLFKLCVLQDYRWWWRSFLTAGFTAVYFFIYAIHYYCTKMTVEGFASGIIYFGYSLIMTLFMLLFTGKCLVSV